MEIKRLFLIDTLKIPGFEFKKMYKLETKDEYVIVRWTYFR